MRTFTVAAAIVGATVALTAVAAAGATPKPKDVCSNLRGVQKKMPHGYQRGTGRRCVKKPAECTGNYVGEADGKCHLIPPSPPPPPEPVAWWPSDYQPWTGDGTNVFASNDHSPLLAYKPSTCKTLGGQDVPNGSTDPTGRICWSYLFQTNVVWPSAPGKSGCGSIFVKLRESSNGVIVGSTIDSADDVPNNTPVQLQGVVSPNGNPNLQLTISSVDCFSP